MKMYFVWDELKINFRQCDLKKCLTVQDLSPCKNSQFVNYSDIEKRASPFKVLALLKIHSNLGVCTFKLVSYGWHKAALG